MCWNWGVSIGFAIGLSLGSLYILCRRRLGFKGTNRDPYEALVVLNLAFVQFWEFLIWLTVYPPDEDLALCPKANTAFTAMVYFHGVLFWPPIVNTFAYKTTTSRKEYFSFPLLFGCLYTILGIADLLYSQFNIAGEFTCGVDGEVFLAWNVALSESRILPNGYDWFLFTAFPFVFYRPRPVGFYMAIYLVLTFAIPYMLVALSEAASVFCWLGLGIFLLYLVEPIIGDYFERKHPTIFAFDLFTWLHSKFRKGKSSDVQRLRSPVMSTESIEMGEKKVKSMEEDDEDVKTEEADNSDDETDLPV
eukprot:TRINITY_DN1502_c0_g1_i1.p1 TRINITY_DN1502_c0_g1~~TRINITY_DN1502_c0_g1_i1.p1  ORF type:complete len:305 (-),score=47.24 TRINITY_DN1502_c0_g1_i1:99-1013(-)